VSESRPSAVRASPNTCVTLRTQEVLATYLGPFPPSPLAPPSPRPDCNASPDQCANRRQLHRILGIVTKSVKSPRPIDMEMYAVPNSGWWYDAGFLLGTWASLPVGWIAALIAVAQHVL
jgi:hypothetical protein